MEFADGSLEQSTISRKMSFITCLPKILSRLINKNKLLRKNVNRQFCEETLEKVKQKNDPGSNAIIYNTIMMSRLKRMLLYSYLVGCCPISDLFGKGEPILGEAQAESNIGFPLPSKSDIGRAVDQVTVLLFPPRKCLHFSSLKEIWMTLSHMYVSLTITRSNYKLYCPSCTIEEK